MNAPRNAPIAAALFVLIVVVAAILRLYDLDRRLMHGDEANQAIKAAILLESGKYEYDPHEHHGPTLYYASWIVERLLGHDSRVDMTETSLRLVPALFGVGTIALVWAVRAPLGSPATLFAALLLALSPALTFYSRYYIQETLLAFFTLAAVGFGWRYVHERRLAWGIVTAAAVALMFATKETWVIAAAAMVVAGVVARPWRTSHAERLSTRTRLLHASAMLVTAIAIWAAFFSSFGTHWRGLVDSFGAYTAYVGRGGAPADHAHPWHFYLARLAWHHPGPGPHWTEAFILASAVSGILVSLVPRSKWVQGDVQRFELFLAIFTLVTVAGFSVIRYKTPWNLIQFHVFLCVLGGIGLGTLWVILKTRPARVTMAVLVLAACTHLGWLNHAANFEYPEYPYNPYVYGHTSSAFQRLIGRIATLSEALPEGNRMLIAVIQPDGDYWPLPWYLRGYTRVGYWTAIPDPLPNADVFILDAGISKQLHEKLQHGYTFETHGLRPRILRTVYVRKTVEE